MKDTMDLNIKELENSELEISGEIPTEEFEKYRVETIKKIGKVAAKKKKKKINLK